MLDKREATLRGSETHLLEMKAELEQIVTRHEQTVDAERNDNKPLNRKRARTEKAKPAAKPRR